jgi:lysophospholipase L1-like esterase
MAATLVSILQGVLFALVGTGAHRLVGVTLSVATLAACWICYRVPSRWGLGVLWTLLSAELVLFAAHLLTSPTPFPQRLLHTAVLLAYLAPLLGAALAAARWIGAAESALLAYSLGVAILVGEVLFDWSRGPVRSPPGAEVSWMGKVRRHPELGFYHVPGSSAISFFPDNPRGYFERAPMGVRLWRLQTEPGSSARMELGDESDTSVRVVEIRPHAAVGGRVRPHFISVAQAVGRMVQPGDYRLGFSARADAPRAIGVAVRQSHRPWKRLGLSETLDVTPAWQTFELPFSVADPDFQPLVQFNLAGATPAVEIADVALVREATGEALPPRVEPPFVVRFAFNQRGCRGPDYSASPEDGTTRLLALGDSYTLGTGVHEADAFPSQLQTVLNERGSAGGDRYEVINCGVGGYDTRQERRHYELIGSEYEPDIILLTMTCNDDRSYLEEVEKGYVGRHPGRFAFLFNIWNSIQGYATRAPERDFSASVEEIKLLDQQVRQRGARLAVVIYRNNEDWPPWLKLLQQVSEGLEGTGVPVLDLGPALFAEHEEEELEVHPTDGHPNEIAHRIAAQETASFLRREGLLPD